MATPVPAAVADYQIVRLLGEGNHGRFFLARPPQRLKLADEFVALKVFGDPCGEQAYERGVRELRAFAAVDSPYLVRVFDAVLQDTFVYAMEYFPAGSLAVPARPLSRDQVLAALRHAALAAHALHECGLAHSDIKPANIMTTSAEARQPNAGQPNAGQPNGGQLSAGPASASDGGKLSDLGLARFLAPGNTLTGMGRASSVEFMDPALLGGARPSRASEVWALGASLHRALAGTGLYGELPDSQPLLAIRRMLSSKPTIDPALAAPEAQLVRDCLAPPGQRLGTAAAVAERIAALLPAQG